MEYIKTRRARVLLSQIWKWCCIVLKSSALLSIWVWKCHPVYLFVCISAFQSFVSYITFIFQIFVIPVLIGLLFELLVIVPMRVPVDESPVFLLYQDWALGLIFLKIWTRLVSFRLLTSMKQLYVDVWYDDFSFFWYQG